MLTQRHYYLIPIVFVTVITDQVKASGDKHVLATLNSLELHTHVINILLITNRERLACGWHSTILGNGNIPYQLQHTVHA